MKHLITPRDWSRFTPYAKRVRTWQQEDLSYIDETVVDHIAFGRLPGYILPRLTHMEVSGTSVAGIHLQTLLICPALEAIHISNVNPSPDLTWAIRTFFRTLADRVPSLTMLSVLWGGSTNTTANDPIRTGLSDVYNGITSLQKLHLNSPGCLNTTSFASIARLPSLSTLHLNLVGIENIDDLCSQVPDPHTAFPSLQNVFLAGSIPAFRKTLELYGAQRMVSIGFSVREYPKAATLRVLFEAVALQFASSLRIIQFQVPKEELDSAVVNRLFTSSPEQYQMNMNVLQPLLSLSDLVAVHLELGVPLQLNDGDLRTIGKAWPKIEILHLCSDPFCERTRGVRPVSSLHGLISTVEQCPRLQHLGLCLDYGSFMDDELLLRNRTVSKSVYHLDVGRSWLTEPPRVASLLSGVFPSLKVFMWSGMDDPESWSGLTAGHSPGWKQVFDLLPVFRATRLNERTVRCLA